LSASEEAKKISRYYGDVRYGKIDPYLRKEAILKWARSLQRKLVLDIGSGTGAYLREFADQDALAVGLDISLGALQFSRNRAKEEGLLGKVDHVIGDARALPIRVAVFDLVLCSEVLEHIPEYLKVIEEISRVVRREGEIIVTVPNGKAFSLFETRFFQLFPGRRAPIDREFTSFEITSAIKKGRLKVERMESAVFLSTPMYLLSLLPSGRKLATVVDRALLRVFKGRGKYLIILCRMESDQDTR